MCAMPLAQESLSPLHPDQQLLRPWPIDQAHSADEFCRNNPNWIAEQVANLVWPQQSIVFISDTHADADAFLHSLLMAGVLDALQAQQDKWQLTEFGQQAQIIIGGDCLDKGPSNLNMLRALNRLRQTGAQVVILAGNHDVRFWMGLRSFGQARTVKTEHMFIRMGEKIVPLFKEIFAEYGLAEHKSAQSLPSEAQCREILYPREDWFTQFPVAVEGELSAPAINRELLRMRRKYDNFADACEQAGMSLQDVYLIAKKCEQLFMQKDGEFNWFFSDMQLLQQSGSLLFVHAGLDDQLCDYLCKRGVERVNRLFKQQMQNDLFDFYYGWVANALRTKYRHSDLPFSQLGADKVKAHGMNLVVHGHVNRLQGQRLASQQQLLHIESDVTLDQHSRREEQITGTGAGYVAIYPDKRIVAQSKDMPFAKVL